MNLPSSPAPLAVLDTNVVLDWLVFRSPDCTAIRDAIFSGSLRWIATAAMRDELAHVLSRGALDRWKPDLPALWTAWGRHCAESPTPSFAKPLGRLRCSDPDDQKFIDFAVNSGARWLLSHDRAVLKLGRRLSELGIGVVTPARWAILQASEQISEGE